MRVPAQCIALFSFAILLLAVVPARAVMNGLGQDIFPVAAVFQASATITYTNAANAGLTVSSGLMVNNGTIGLAVSGGKVGIGTAAPAARLEIAGGVKLANDSDTCDSSKAGTMRWTGTLFQGCTGTVWRTFLSQPSGTTQANAGRTCKKLLDDGFSTGDGTYWIDPDEGDTSNAFQAYCDMTTDGGGWTLVLRASQNFGTCRTTVINGAATALAPLNPTESTDVKMFSQTTANQIKTSIADTIGIRMKRDSGANPGTKYLPADCGLNYAIAGMDAAACRKMTLTYSGTPSWTTTDMTSPSNSNQFGTIVSDANRLIAAVIYDGANCFDAYGWGESVPSSIWVR